MRTLVKFVASAVFILVAVVAAAITFGGPRTPPALASISDPFKAVDFSDLPPLRYFTAKDGASLAYRSYPASGSAARGSIVLVHGSSASSSSMHVLAKAYSVAGYAAYALDIRGHGASGRKGTISYIGQLEDDIDAFVHAVSLPKPSTLAGFSSGGGFVLRFAGSARQDEFQSYLLLSPYLTQNAPNYRPASGGWVSVGVARVVALSALSAAGIDAFNDLPVVRFALNERNKSFLTPEYSFSLAANFQPRRDYEANIRAVRQPVSVLGGTNDELFYTDKLEGTFRAQGKTWPVMLLPGVGHIALTLDRTAIDAAVKAVEAMRPHEV